MPCAIVLGCPPYVAFMGPQKLPIDVDEIDVAGGLAGAPINVVRAKHGRSAGAGRGRDRDRGPDRHRISSSRRRRSANRTATSRSRNSTCRCGSPRSRIAGTPIIPSYISQVAPSESSVIKRVAYEPLFLAHLRDTLGIRGVKRVSLHEPLTGLLRVTVDHAREGHAAHRGLARALRRGLLQGRLRQDLHRGQRGHRSRQRRRAAVGDGLSHEPGRGRAGAAASRPGPRPQARARPARRIRRC